MKGEDTVIDFPGTPVARPVDLADLSLQRAGHVAAIRAIDNTYAREMERIAADLENVCQLICGTSIALPTLPPGVLEESRQIAAGLPGMIQRFTRLMNPVVAK